jgi:hypothetical protein
MYLLHISVTTQCANVKKKCFRKKGFGIEARFIYHYRYFYQVMIHWKVMEIRNDTLLLLATYHCYWDNL